MVLVNLKEKLNKHKIIVIILIALLALCIILPITIKKEEPTNEPTSTDYDKGNYIELYGSEVVNIYQGTEYKEFGYKAYNKDKKDTEKITDKKEISKLHTIWFNSWNTT